MLQYCILINQIYAHIPTGWKKSLGLEGNYYKSLSNHVLIKGNIRYFFNKI